MPAGIREWKSGIVDVPAMGETERVYTNGYFKSGQIPTFKILKRSSGKLITLTGTVSGWEDNGFYIISSLNELLPKPESFILENAYPNPFNPITLIEYGLSKDTDVHLTIYDVNGRLVEELVNEYKLSGYYKIEWNANSYPSGMYILQMHTNQFISTQKLMHIK